jgi:hypothetical protein
MYDFDWGIASQAFEMYVKQLWRREKRRKGGGGGGREETHHDN